MSTQTIQQQRAKHTLKAIDNWLKPNSGIRSKNMRSYASSLPAMIMTNGLGQTVAFAMTKKNSEQEYLSLLDNLSNWLIKELQIFGNTQQPDLIHHLTNCNMKTYQLAQSEAIIYLGWVKKMVKALMSINKGE